LTGADADHKEVGRPAGVNGQVFDEFMATGAVVAGRGTFEPAGGWGGDHHDGVPIFILSRREPGIDVSQWPLVTYVNGVTTAMAQAKEAAGGKKVLVHGAATAQLALAAGLLDELELHLVPVLLGQGRRLFDHLGPEHVELERTRILEGRPASPTCTTGSSAEVQRSPAAGGVHGC
jgi:dihydrofolate reductase